MITYPSGTTAPFPNSREIGNLFLTNSLAQDRRCTLQDLRVFLWLLGIMKWGNQVRVSQTSIAAALGMSRQNVWATLQRLMQHGLVLPGPKVGTRATYWVSTAYAYYGPLDSHRWTRQQEWARQKLEALAQALAQEELLQVGIQDRVSMER